MKKNFIGKLYLFGLRYPWIVLGAALVLSIISVNFAKKLKLQTDFSTLLPIKAESVQNIKELQEAFGSLEHIYIAIDGPDPKTTKSYAEALASSLEELPDIQYVEYQWPVDYFSKRKWFFLENEDLKEMVQRTRRSLQMEKDGVNANFNVLMHFADEEDRPDLTFKDIKKKYEDKFGKDIIREDSEEGETFLVVKARPHYGAENLDDNKALMAKVSQIADKHRSQKEYSAIQVGYSGTYQKSIEAYELFGKNILLVSSIVFLILILILIVYFRSLSGAFLVCFPLALGILWSGGILYLFLGQVNVVTGFAISILAGLGSDYGIYLLSRYFKERKAGKSFEKACELSFSRTGRATWMAMVTSAGTFLALLISDFEVFFEFGLVGGLGLFLNFLAMMLVLPSLLEIGRRHQKRFWSFLIRWSPKAAQGSPQASWVPKVFTLRGSAAVVVGTIILITISAFTLQDQRKIYFEDGLIDPPNIPSNQLYERISGKTGGSLSPTAILVKGKENERKVVEGFQKVLEENPPEDWVYNRVVGISSFVPQGQQEKRSLLKKLSDNYQKHRYLLDKQKAEFSEDIQIALQQPDITHENLPEEVRRLFVSPHVEDTFMVALYPSIRLGESDNMKIYRDEIYSVRDSLGINFKPVDGALVGAYIIDIINLEAKHGFAILIIFFSLVLFLNLRDIKRTLLILGHILGSMVLLSGALHLLGIRLNILNIAVIPIILGTGIDCFIHFSSRFNEDRDLKAAIRNEIPAILTSNLTSIVGFGGFIFTSAWGLQSIGWVSVIGLVLVTVFCTVVFPRSLALILTLRRKPLTTSEEGLAET